MLVKKENRQQIQVGQDSFVWEYNLDNQRLGVDFGKFNGRFPSEGRVKNNVCQECIYIVSGRGEIFIEDDIFELNEGDVFLIETGKRYYFIGENMSLVCSSSPRWYAEQQEKVE